MEKILVRTHIAPIQNKNSNIFLIYDANFPIAVSLSSVSLF